MTPVKKTTVKKEAEKIVKEVKSAAKEVKAAEKKVAKAASPKKAAAKKTVEKAASTAKKETAKVVSAAKKETARATKKVADTAKKVTAPDSSVYVEFYGKQFSTNEVVDKALKAYKAAHKSSSIKSIEVYVKPEENVAYYVINGEGSDDYKIYL